MLLSHVLRFNKTPYTKITVKVKSQGQSSPKSNYL